MITAAERSERRLAVCGSHFPSIMGLDEYGTAADTWAYHTGRVPDWQGNEATRIGSAMEPGILRLAERQLGKLKRNVTVRLDSLPFPCLLHLDAKVRNSGEPVEAKSSGVAGDWGDEGSDRVPIRTGVQAQAYMMGTGADVCHVAALIGGHGLAFRLFVVPRVQAFIDQMIDQAEHYWNYHVQRDIPPEGVLPSEETLKRWRRQPKLVATIEPEIVLGYKLADEKFKAADQERKEWYRRLIASIGDAEAGDAGDAGYFTYFAQSRDGLDVEALRCAYPEIAEQFRKVTEYRVLRFPKHKESN